jgi:hypothetical protein
MVCIIINREGLLIISNSILISLKSLINSKSILVLT